MIPTVAERRHRGARRPASAEVLRRLGAASMLALLTACGSDGGDQVTMSGGQALYAENCAMCHGTEALGDGPMAASLPVAAPALKEHLGHHSQAQLVRLIQGGVPPAMPPTELSAEDIQQIVDYLWTLVPEDEVAALRAMQQQMEMGGDSAGGAMPGTGGMGGMGAMPGMGAGHEMHQMEMAVPADSGAPEAGQ